MFQNEAGNLALFCGRQRLYFFQNGLGFRAHCPNYTIPLQTTSDSNVGSFLNSGSQSVASPFTSISVNAPEPTT